MRRRCGRTVTPAQDPMEALRRSVGQGGGRARPKRAVAPRRGLTNEMNRGAVLMSGVTLGSLVALLIRAGLRNRRPPGATLPCRLLAVSREPRTLAPQTETAREDVLERYRLAAAV
jgi:hypothetical protein